MTSEENREQRSGLGRAIEAGLEGEAISAQGVFRAIGGWQGIVESLVPATVYLVTFVVTQDARMSVIAPLALAALAIVWRIARREPLSAALSGLIGVLVCVAAVLFTGEGSSYFVPGFFINAAWIVAHSVSLLIGWPLIGLLMGFLRGSLTAWRKVPMLRRAAQLTTILWIVIFAARLAVQLPLYFAGDIEALWLARLVMGVPLFALAVVFTWMVLARVGAMVDTAAPAPMSDTQELSDKTQSSDE